MKDSKTARGKGSLNLSMNKRTRRLWRKTSLVLSLRQSEKLRMQAPTSMPCTELPMCLPSYAARLPPSLPALPHGCQSCSRHPHVNAGCSHLKCSLYPHPTREDTRLHSFPLFGILVCRGLTYPYSSSNRPAPHPLYAGATKSAQSAQMPPV